MRDVEADYMALLAREHEGDYLAHMKLERYRREIEEKKMPARRECTAKLPALVTKGSQ